MNDISIENWLPPWAVSEITDGQVMVPMAHLSTRDGRVCGNAVLYDIVAKTYNQTGDQIFEYARVITDAGNILILNQVEIQQLFHPPQYVMRKLLITHKTALEGQ